METLFIMGWGFALIMSENLKLFSLQKKGHSLEHQKSYIANENV